MKTYTSFFETKEQFKKFDSEWKLRANKKEISATDMALRALLLDRNIYDSFTPIRRPSKLNNGHTKYGALQNAISNWNIGKTWIFDVVPEAKDSEYLTSRIEQLRLDIKTRNKQ